MGKESSLGAGFRALFVGSLVSNAGDGIRLAALPLLAASLTSSPFLISAVTAAQYLPWITFALFGGALVDRWDRRRTILITQTWRGFVMVGLVVLLVTSDAAIWQVCIVAFAITAGEILVDPSTVALVPTLVDEADLDRANGRISGAEIATNDFAGGPIGTVLFGFGPWVPFLVDASTYLGSVLPFSRLPRPTPAERRNTEDERPVRSVVAEAAEGFRWLRRHSILGPLTLAQIVYFFGLAASLALLVELVTGELGASGRAFGFVLAINAGGGFIGTLIGATVAARFGPRLSLAGAVVLQAVTLAAAATAPSVGVLAVLWLINGVPAGAQRPIARSLQQRLTPNELLGRVNVTARIFTRGVIVFGALFAGVLATAGGVRVSFAVGGLAQAVAAAMMWRALGRSEGPDPRLVG